MNTHELWKSNFGDEYTARNIDKVKNNVEFFKKFLPKDIESLIEFGAGSGQNIIALKQLISKATMDAVEINQSAINLLKQSCDTVYEQSIESFSPLLRYDLTACLKWDLTFTKGVLIHIHPVNLNLAYDALYKYSKKYVLICEYFNPTPIEVEYRGRSNAMWKRDFCSEMLNKYNDLKLIDYGFVYDRDEYPQDNLHYFLVKKV